MTKADTYESIADSYQAAYATDHVVLHFLDRALGHLAPESRILDAGCGTGNPVSVALVEAGHHVKGIDISPAMLDLYRKNVPTAQCEVTDMCSYQHPTEEPLDAVFNIRALFGKKRNEIEHIIQNWGTWVQSGGLLCMVVIALDDYNPAKIVGGVDPDGYCATVKRRFMGEDSLNALFSRAGWRYLLETNGFDIVEEETELFVPPDEVDSDDAPQFCFIARKI
ncbi:hypothetical protein ABOM_004347 [Aspergillus bombycis]|uniref:Methyltransferase domain-containing protein n=1 Tax=Aspergillus bombycis TaxID=109264 RepID=A0A1F8A7K7_9EURO|nr:hypothetical protein ABOM_004347 [Aspergillus bombycis]OGM47722.1 hypothetical protein ABOM_004347 [Aspergillus bombycis]